MEQWLGSSDLQLLSLSISDAALKASCDGTTGEVELRPACKLKDARVDALVAAVNAERIAGFPSGRLFLDSVEQALAAALVNDYAVGAPFRDYLSRRPRPRALEKGRRAGVREDRR
jgi:AraC family transcriptional regulator